MTLNIKGFIGHINLPHKSPNLSKSFQNVEVRRELTVFWGAGGWSSNLATVPQRRELRHPFSPVKFCAIRPRPRLFSPE